MGQIGSRLLKVKIGATDLTLQCSKLEIQAVDVDGPVTFSEAAAGGAKMWKLVGTALQDTASGSIWRTVWAAAGSTVAVVVNPFGVATFVAGSEGYSGNCVVAQPDGAFIGGEADPSVSMRRTFDFEWTFTAKPTELTTGSF